MSAWHVQDAAVHQVEVAIAATPTGIRVFGPGNLKCGTLINEMAISESVCRENQRQSGWIAPASRNEGIPIPRSLPLWAY